MSTSFSANQYERAFKSQKLQNWTIPKQFKERPSAAEGYTTFIATDRGHLLPGLKTKRGSAWPSFQGTWDLPRHIPPVYINPTARSQEGQDRLRRTWGKTKSITSQAPEDLGGSRASQNEENTNVIQHAEESKIIQSNSDQEIPEMHTEQPRPNSQDNQPHSRPTSQSGQQVRPEEVNLACSRPASRHSQV
ncbi:protein Flattop isoform X2 [Paramisgurnus dabryanus]|uniref:protein Flattop isoform X2 n=1 Tax=Paramisgurnus dabryanus TaxID=90735 RepID=UPI0031F3E159